MKTITRNARFAAAPALAALALLAGAPAALADVDATKFVTWTFKDAPKLDKDGKVDGTVKGAMKWKFDCFVTDGKAKDSDGSNSFDSWKLVDGLAATPYASKKLAVGGNTASSEVIFSSGKPAKNAFTDLWEVSTSMQVKAAAKAAGGKADAARAYVSAEMTVPGAQATGAVLKEGKNISMKPFAKVQSTVNFSGSAKNGWSDPFTVGIYDGAGNLVDGQQLASVEGLALEDGEMLWDSQGLRLNAPQDGISSASLSIDVTGSWVTNMDLGKSSVSLKDGLLTTTGIFAGLAWNLADDGKSAWLNPGVMDTLEIAYTVASNLLSDDTVYQEQLTIGNGAESVVPTPGTAALLGLAGLAAAKRRRR